MNNAHGIFFKNKKFIRLNTSELLFDLVLIFYVKYFLYIIVSGGRMLYQSISFEWLIYIGPLIAFFITWYTGFLAARKPSIKK